MFLEALGHFTGTFSVLQVARILQVSEAQVSIWIDNRTLASRKVLGMTRVDYTSVRKAVAAGYVTAQFGYKATAQELLEAGKRYF